MGQFENNLETTRAATGQRAIWRRALTSVFGAAQRLHRYRDVRDVLLRHAILEQERQIRQRAHCDEQC